MDMQNERRLVQVRLSEQVVKAVDRLSVEWDLYRAEAIERLLREAIENHRVGNWPYELPSD